MRPLWHCLRGTPSRCGRLTLRAVGVLGALVVLGGIFAPGTAADEEKQAPDYPKEVPVVVSGEVDASRAASTGKWVLKLSFRVEASVTRPYSVYLRVLRQGNTLRNYDHAPKPATRTWRKGKTVSYEIPIPVPMESWIQAGHKLEVVAGLFDAEADKIIRPRNEKVSQGFVRVATLVVPELPPTDAEEIATAILAEAKQRQTEGKPAEAWAVLETAIRRAEEDVTKYRFRDALTALGHFAPRPISFYETQVVDRRIKDEKRRYLKLMSSRYYGRRKLFAALRILEAVGGSLEEDAGEAVIGAVGEAQRAKKGIQDIQMRITTIPQADKDAARALITKHGLSKACLQQGERFAKEKAYGKAKYIFRELMTISDKEIAFPARAAYDALEKAWLADTPPDEQALVDQAVNHPAFGRLGTMATHNFIYIGPKTMIEAIPTKSRLRFDIAYIFQTDLFGRLPNPAGDRITVFLKELWDFGGGQGGGRIIDIGRADPKRKGYRVDTGLMYHELIHCVDDTSPILAGFREGLANMGAAYTFEAIGQKGDTLHAFARNLFAFRKDYLERDLPYWRIQGYQPSAGFFLHFVDKHSRRGKDHNWKPYRQFFREYREAPIRDGREPYIARALAYYLIRAFGPAAFDDLLTFRFPLIPSDREAVKLEMEAFAKGDYAVRKAGEKLREVAPGSQLPRDLAARRMLEAAKRGQRDQAREISQQELGVLHDWMICGPFSAQGADPRAAVYPPEYEIDFKKEYPGGQNIAKWRPAADKGMVVKDAIGWVDLRFNYNDNTATYALSHVTVDKDQDAAVHLRCDDDFMLFVNDRLIDSYINRGQAGSTLLWWRGPYEKAPDAMRLTVPLKKGRNKILLKVKNRTRESGFILAVCQPNGQPIKGMMTDRRAPASGNVTRDTPRKSAWKTQTKHRFTKKSFKSKLKVTVGAFKVENKQLVGTSTAKGVQWRKYTVRPGFPKDAPSNLFWFKEKLTKDVAEFRLSLDVATKNGRPPKMVVTFMGEGETDGLSGWNLIVHPRGDKVAARLERYDILVYQVRPQARPKPKKKQDKKKADAKEAQPLVLTYVDGRFTARLGGLVLLDNVPIKPIRGRTRIGVSTYGPNLGIEGLKLEALIR